MMQSKWFFAVVPLLTLLSACNVSQNVGQQPASTVPNSVDGRWVDSQGMITMFRGGLFETRTPDTNEKLSEGSYRLTSPQLIELDMRSLVRGSISRVNCGVSSNFMTLQCTTQDGKQFMLTRRL